MLTHHHEHEEVHMCSEDHSNESATICHHELECELCSHFAQQVNYNLPSDVVSLDVISPATKTTEYSDAIGVYHVLLPPTRGSPVRS